MNLLDKLGLGGQRAAQRIDASTLDVTRTSVLTGKTRTMSLPITKSQWAAYEQGDYIQRCLAHLTAEQREFILSGMDPEEWNDFADSCEKD